MDGITSTGSDSIAQSKAVLRARAKANRAALDVAHVRVCAGLRRFLDQASIDGWIVAFDAMPGEPDLSGLFDDRPERRIALTRTPVRGVDLTVHDGRAEREQHPFGYEQPTADAPEIDDDEIGAVLVPGLAFDRHGGRLGFGAGYYDRFLSRLDPAVLRIGVSDGFIVERVPTDETDVPMTHLATEVGVVSLPLGG